MPLEVIPKSLYLSKKLKPMLSDERSSILRKTLTDNLINTGKYIATPLVVYIVQGRQVIRDPDGIDHVIGEGHLIFLPRDVYVVSDYVATPGVFEAFLFFIDGEVIERYLRSSVPPMVQSTDKTASRCGPYSFQANAQISRYIHSLGDVYTAAENTAALLELKLLELLHLIAIQDRSFEFIKALSGEASFAKRPITEFMERYQGHDLKVEDYASLSGRSASTFVRDFKKAYNTTPSQWIIDRRVARAHRMLIEQNLSVGDAALEAGYDSVSHFIKAYRRKFGVTPHQAKAIV